MLWISIEICVKCIVFCKSTRFIFTCTFNINFQCSLICFTVFIFSLSLRACPSLKFKHKMLSIKQYKGYQSLLVLLVFGYNKYLATTQKSLKSWMFFLKSACELSSLPTSMPSRNKSELWPSSSKRKQEKQVRVLALQQ